MKIKMNLGGYEMTYKVPENMDPGVFADKIEATYLKDKEAGMFDRVSPSNFKNLLAGIGRGMTNVVRQVGNMAGVVSDETLGSAAERDAELLDTKAGATGN